MKEATRYLASESHRILQLWRARQRKGEVAFKFDYIVGRDKQPKEAAYPEGIFGTLLAAGSTGAGLESQPTEQQTDGVTEGQGNDDKDDEESTEDEEVPTMIRKLAISDTESEPEAVIAAGPENEPIVPRDVRCNDTPLSDGELEPQHQKPSKKKKKATIIKRNRIVDDSEQSDSPRTLRRRGPQNQQPGELTTRSCSPTLAPSSLTLAGSSPTCDRDALPSVFEEPHRLIKENGP